MSKNGPLIVSSPTGQSRLSVKAKQLIVESDWTVIYIHASERSFHVVFLEF